jgi:hypothetical protein
MIKETNAIISRNPNDLRENKILFHIYGANAGHKDVSRFQISHSTIHMKNLAGHKSGII